MAVYYGIDDAEATSARAYLSEYRKASTAAVAAREAADEAEAQLQRFKAGEEPAVADMRAAFKALTDLRDRMASYPAIQAEVAALDALIQACPSSGADFAQYLEGNIEAMVAGASAIADKLAEIAKSEGETADAEIKTVEARQESRGAEQRRLVC